jgi:hypothetical protein
MPNEWWLNEEGRRRLLFLRESEERLAGAKAAAWARKNAEAIRVHNERIAKRGIFGADARRW